MPTLLLFNKPYRVLCQFSPEKIHKQQQQQNLKEEKETLAIYIDKKEVYPAGRLDYDSEGLLLLTDDGALQHHISHPQNKQPKTYWVQVEGEKNLSAILQLRQGINLKDGPTRPALVEVIPHPELWPRTPPVRFRKHIPTHWLSITITEGRNRQVRRMTAAVGLPTLRLIRARIGDWTLEGLQPGEYRCIEVDPVLPQVKQKRDNNGTKRTHKDNKANTRIHSRRKNKQHQYHKAK